MVEASNREPIGWLPRSPFADKLPWTKVRELQAGYSRECWVAVDSIFRLLMAHICLVCRRDDRRHEWLSFDPRHPLAIAGSHPVNNFIHDPTKEKLEAIMFNFASMDLAEEAVPFEVVTPFDHSAWVIISAAVGLSLILVIGGIRAFVRVTLGHGFGRDDIFLLASTVVGVVQNAIVLGATAHGLGKPFVSLSTRSQDQVQIMYYASNQLYGAALGLSRTSVLWFLLRLTPVAWHQRIIYVVMALLMVWQLAFVFAIALECNLTRPWILVGATCPGILTRWEVLESTGLAFEIATFGIATWLVWDLKTDLSNKIAVVSTFSFRLLMAIFVGFRLASFDSVTLTTDPTLGLAPFIAWTSAEMNYSIVAATIPALRPFVVNLVTHYGGGQMHSRDNSYADGTLVPFSQRSASKSHELSKVSSVQTQRADRASMQSKRTSVQTKRDSIQTRRSSLQAKRESMQSSKRQSSHNPDGTFRGVTHCEVGSAGLEPKKKSLSLWHHDSIDTAMGHDVEMQSPASDESQNFMIRKEVKIDVQHGKEQV